MCFEHHVLNTMVVFLSNQWAGLSCRSIFGQAMMERSLPVLGPCVPTPPKAEDQLKTHMFPVLRRFHVHFLQAT